MRNKLFKRALAVALSMALILPSNLSILAGDSKNFDANTYEAESNEVVFNEAEGYEQTGYVVEDSNLSVTGSTGFTTAEAIAKFEANRAATVSAPEFETVSEPTKVTAEDFPISEQLAYERIMALQTSYPEGMHWTNDNYYKLSIWIADIGWMGGYGCAGFGFICSDAAFGNGINPGRKFYDMSEIRVGDWLRVSNDAHTVVALEVYDDYIIVTEGNYNSSIHWGRKITRTAMAQGWCYGITRYPENYGEPEEPTEEPTVDPEPEEDPFENIPSTEWGWVNYRGHSFWHEGGVRQGTYSDSKGVLGDGTVRGREIYDPDSNGWYWLDSCYEGAKAINKEVWIPYIYQNEASWSEEEILANAAASNLDAQMAEQVVDAIKNKSGKWVRYDANGKMYKGWYMVEGDDAKIYPNQEDFIYYYDEKTGLMAKGWTYMDGYWVHFDEITGVFDDYYVSEGE